MDYIFGQADFWENWSRILTSVGAIAIYIAALAAGVAGAIKLVQWAAQTGKWGFNRYRERRRVDAVLDDLTSADGWPNGSRSIKESHQNLYDKALVMADTMESIQITLNNITQQLENIITK